MHYHYYSNKWPIIKTINEYDITLGVETRKFFHLRETNLYDSIIQPNALHGNLYHLTYIWLSQCKFIMDDICKLPHLKSTHIEKI